MRNRLLLGAFAAFLGATLFNFLRDMGGGYSVENRNPDPAVVTIKIWAGNASAIDRWRTESGLKAAERLNVLLEEEGAAVSVEVEAVNDPASWGNYKKKFILAGDSHLGPDIVCTGHEDVAAWSSAGLIIPLAESVEVMRAKDPAFADILEELWPSTMFRGKVWGVPQDSEARVLFFSKPLLAKLGYSPSRIADLARRIDKGSFSIDDMIALAEEAVRKKVVPPGYGYWPRPTKGGDHIQKYVAYGGRILDPASGKLVVDRESLEKWYAFQRRIVTSGITPKNYIGTDWGIWHATVARGEVLFWEGGIWNWALWARKYVNDLGGQDFLERTVGYALPPTGVPGVRPLTLSHPLVYLVTQPAVSGQRQQVLALRLLALMTTPELNTLHALESSHLAILKSQLSYPPYRQDRFLFDISKIAGNSFFQPNHTRFSFWFDAVWQGMVEAQTGALTPAQAASQAIELILVDVDEEDLILL